MHLNGIMSASLAVALGRASAETACLTREECARTGRARGIAAFPHSDAFPSKGCYTEDGTAYFSPGTDEEMSRTDLPGRRARLWCESVSSAPDGRALRDAGGNEDRATAGVSDPTPCLTEEACRNKRQEMADGGDAGYFQVGSYPTKGCFSKKGNVYFSLHGTEEEMSTPEVSGIQERIWCGTLVSNDADGNRGSSEAFINGTGSATVSTSDQSSMLTGEPPDKPAKENTACPTEEACKQKSQDMGFTIFYSNNTYPSKGCYSKSTTAYFSFGSNEDMSTPDLPGVQTRIWCNGGLSKSDTSETSFASPSPTHSPTAEHEGSSGAFANDTGSATLSTSAQHNVLLDRPPNDPTEENTPCPTEEACKQKSKDMDFAIFYSNNTFPSKGCYSKNSTAYFSFGSDEDMSTTDLPGVQKRIWCNDGSSKSGTSESSVASPSPVYSPTYFPTYPPTVSGRASSPDTSGEDSSEEPTGSTESNGTEHTTTPTATEASSGTASIGETSGSKDTGRNNSPAPFPIPTLSPTQLPSTDKTWTPTPDVTTAPSQSPEKSPTDSPTKTPASTPTAGALSPDPTSGPSGSAGRLFLRPPPSPSIPPTKMTTEPTVDRVDPPSTVALLTGNETPMKSSTVSVDTTLLNHGITAVAIAVVFSLVL